MTKPLDPKLGHPNVPFDTPVSMDELKALKAKFALKPIRGDSFIQFPRETIKQAFQSGYLQDGLVL